MEWRQYPMDLLALAVDKGEAQALADGDPRTWLLRKEGKLDEVATNLSEEYAHRTCCVLAIRGSLIRDEPTGRSGADARRARGGRPRCPPSRRRGRGILGLWRQRVG